MAESAIERRIKYYEEFYDAKLITKTQGQKELDSLIASLGKSSISEVDKDDSSLDPDVVARIYGLNDVLSTMVDTYIKPKDWQKEDLKEFYEKNYKDSSKEVLETELDNMLKELGKTNFAEVDFDALDVKYPEYRIKYEVISGYLELLNKGKTDGEDSKPEEEEKSEGKKKESEKSSEEEKEAPKEPDKPTEVDEKEKEKAEKEITEKVVTVAKGQRKIKMIRIVKYVLATATVAAISALTFGTGFIPSALIGSLASTAWATVDAIKDNIQEKSGEAVTEEREETEEEKAEREEIEKEKAKKKEEKKEAKETKKAERVEAKEAEKNAKAAAKEAKKTEKEEKRAKKDSDLFREKIENSLNRDRESGKENLDKIRASIQSFVNKNCELEQEKKDAIVSYIVNKFLLDKKANLREKMEVDLDDETAAKINAALATSLLDGIEAIKKEITNKEMADMLIRNFKDYFYLQASLAGPEKSIEEITAFGLDILKDNVKNSLGKFDMTEDIKELVDKGLEFTDRAYDLARIDSRKRKYSKLEKEYLTKSEIAGAKKKKGETFLEKIKRKRAERRAAKRASVDEIDIDDDVLDDESEELGDVPKSGPGFGGI